MGLLRAARAGGLPLGQHLHDLPFDDSVHHDSRDGDDAGRRHGRDGFVLRLEHGDVGLRLRARVEVYRLRARRRGGGRGDRARDRISKRLYDYAHGRARHRRDDRLRLFLARLRHAALGRHGDTARHRAQAGQPGDSRARRQARRFSADAVGMGAALRRRDGAHLPPHLVGRRPALHRRRHKRREDARNAGRRGAHGRVRLPRLRGGARGRPRDRGDGQLVADAGRGLSAARIRLGLHRRHVGLRRQRHGLGHGYRLDNDGHDRGGNSKLRLVRILDALRRRPCAPALGLVLRARVEEEEGKRRERVGARGNFIEMNRARRWGCGALVLSEGKKRRPCNLLRPRMRWDNEDFQFCVRGLGA